MGLYEKNLVAFKRDPGRENMNIKVKFYKKTLGLPRSGQIVPSLPARTIFPYNLPRRYKKSWSENGNQEKKLLDLILKILVLKICVLKLSVIFTQKKEISLNR